MKFRQVQLVGFELAVAGPSGASICEAVRNAASSESGMRLLHVAPDHDRCLVTLEWKRDLTRDEVDQTLRKVVAQTLELLADQLPGELPYNWSWWFEEHYG